MDFRQNRGHRRGEVGLRCSRGWKGYVGSGDAGGGSQMLGSRGFAVVELMLQLQVGL